MISTCMEWSSALSFPPQLFRAEHEPLRSPRGKIASHLNQMVGDYPEPYPSLHALESAIQTATQTVPSFECADAAF